jgi:very-short-patch-repair endonuclease
MEDNKTVLIAVFKTAGDMEIAMTQNWYMIPFASAPKAVEEKNIQTIAFYQNESFGEDKNCIRYYSSVKSISVVTYKELFPGVNGLKAGSKYYKIEFAPLIRLAKPITNHNQKSFTFITTSLEKFYKSRDAKNFYVGKDEWQPPKKDMNTVLVAIMNSTRDFEIARTQQWYRIPKESAPDNVKTRLIQTIAFYHTNIFKEEKFSVRYYASVTNISEVKRKELLPDEINDPKAEYIYFKIEFGPLLQLKEPIISQHGRRIIFIPTSWYKFLKAREINDLFNGTKLEEILWEKLVEKNIAAERELFYAVDNRKYFLDFAVFCKIRNIDLECDGDEYHTSKTHVQYDKNRNNLLESEGWSVLRFTWDDLNHHLDESINIICKTIKKYGGLKKL